MTTSEIDRLSRILTDMRVESAAQFARLDERLNAVPDLVSRVSKLEDAFSRVGKFDWLDVFRAAGAAAAVVVVYDRMMH